MTEAEIVESLAAWREAELQAARTGQSVTVYNLGSKQSFLPSQISSRIVALELALRRARRTARPGGLLGGMGYVS